MQTATDRTQCSPQMGLASGNGVNIASLQHEGYAMNKNICPSKCQRFNKISKKKEKCHSSKTIFVWARTAHKCLDRVEKNVNECLVCSQIYGECLEKVNEWEFRKKQRRSEIPKYKLKKNFGQKSRVDFARCRGRRDTAFLA